MRDKKIWIIEDNPADSYVIKTMLEINELTQDVTVFNNNDDALINFTSMESTDTIHIITENKTSSVDGWKLIKELATHSEYLKFHMASTQFSDKDLKKFQNTSSLYSLHKKPLRLDDLIEIINS